MSERQATGIVILVVGLGVLFFMGALVIVGLGFFWIAKSSPPVQPMAVATTMSPPSMIDDALIADPSIAIQSPPGLPPQNFPPTKAAAGQSNLTLKVEGVTRKPDGTCIILATATTGDSSAPLTSFRFLTLELEPPFSGSCSASVPAGPPFRNPLDLVIRTPRIGSEVRELKVRYLFTFSASLPGAPPGEEPREGLLEVKLPEVSTPGKASRPE